MKYLLGEYKTEIFVAKKQKLTAHESIKNKWNNYLSDEYNLSLKSYTIGDYLVKTNWGQGAVYNDSCPDDPVTNVQSLVGCVGVALGQVLNYWGCRVFPDGSISYIPDGFSSPLTVNFYDQDYDWDDIGTVSTATAQFLYHCAVSVRSNFGSSGTTSSIYRARDALIDYFGFNANYPIQKTSYSDAEWINLLKGEVNAERPVIYRGECDTCSTGHAWVVDGYDSLNKFHCNWGWYGTYQNMFYSLSDLTPGTKDYTSDQRAVINIYPKLDGCGEPSGPDLVCSFNESYSVTIPGTASVTWSKSASLNQISGNSYPVYTVNAATSGTTGYVTAAIKNSQNRTILTRTKNVWVGEPDPSDFYITAVDNYGSPIGPSNGPFQVCPNNYYTFYLYPSYNLPESHHKYGISDIDFFFDFDYQIVYGGYGWAYIHVDYIDGNSYGVVYVDSECGGYDEFNVVNVNEGYCGYFLSFTPNPAVGETTLTIESVSKEKTFDESAGWELEIYSETQVLKTKQVGLIGNKYKIQTAGWQEGIYLVRVKYNDEVLTGKLLVKK